MIFKAIALAISILTAAPLAAQAEEALRIAVAANFAPTLETLITSYKTSHPGAPEITLSTGSTGAHFALISRGAPFDMFFAADQARPKRLVETGKAIEQRLYATGIPVLVLAASDAAQAQIATQAQTQAQTPTPQDFASLLKGKTIAIADPALAPYGIAAVQAIRWAGLDPMRDLKLIYGANAGLAASLFALGTSEGAIVAKSQLASIKTHRDFRVFDLNGASHAPVFQHVALISDRPSARAFYQWSLRDQDAARMIRAAGYRLNDLPDDPSFMPTPIPAPTPQSDTDPSAEPNPTAAPKPLPISQSKPTPTQAQVTIAPIHSPAK